MILAPRCCTFGINSFFQYRKRWRKEARFGFVQPLESHFPNVVFLHQDEVNYGGALMVGDVVIFDIVEKRPRKIGCVNVILDQSLAFQKATVVEWKKRKNFGFVRVSERGVEAIIHLECVGSRDLAIGTEVWVKIRQNPERPGRYEVYEVQKQPQHWRPQFPCADKATVELEPTMSCNEMMRTSLVNKSGMSSQAFQVTIPNEMGIDCKTPLDFNQGITYLRKNSEIASLDVYVGKRTLTGMIFVPILQFSRSSISNAWAHAFKSHRFEEKVGMIGTVGCNESWDSNESPPLWMNQKFSRHEGAYIAGIERACACRVTFQGHIFVIGAYTTENRIQPLTFESLTTLC